MKRFLTMVLVIGVCSITNAQNDIDALRYSRNVLGGNARSLGAGNAFGAVGGNLISSSINPAGLGQYKSSEIGFSLGMLSGNNQSEYLGINARDNFFNGNIPSLGLILTQRLYEGNKPVKEGWVNYNFGITYNRTNDFNRIINYEGVNTQNTLMDYFAERSNGLSKSQLWATDAEYPNNIQRLETMFWEGFLIDSIGHRTYGPAINPALHNIHQNGIITQKGNMSEINFSLSGNFSNKLYLGGGLNISTSKFNSIDKFTETDDPRNQGNFNVYTLERNLNTRGVGVGGRLGLIYRASDMLRMGIAMQTPTIFNMTDNYNDRLDVTFDDYSNLALKSLPGTYNYQVITPFKYTGSAAFFFPKKGFISMDLENIDYGTAKLMAKGGGSSMESANKTIKNKYNNTTNIRLGGEMAAGNLKFRGGFARYGNPFQNQNLKNMELYQGSVGIGLTQGNSSLDFAFVKTFTKDINQPYVLNGSTVPFATNRLQTNNITISFTSKF